MRVLYCTRGDSPHDQRFLTALGQSGHEVYALRLQACTPQTPSGVTEVPWEGLLGPLKLSQVPALSARLRTLLRNLEPDLVHAGPIQDVAFLIAQAGFHPLLTMSWGFDLMKDAYLSPLKRWQTRWTLAHSDMLTLDCQATAERAVSFGFPRERICVFPWGVDLNHFSPQSCVAAGKAWRQQQGWNDAIVLLCLRAWEPNYGVDVLARAFVQAAQQNPALRLILLNEGSEAAKIRSVLRAGGVEDRIYFGGRIPNADLTTYFGAADLYISPAHVDGTSVSLLEALACGLPAIVSDIPANLEWVREGENGWIFPDGDDQALAQVILTAAALDWRPMSLQARQDAVERADWSKNFQKLLKCYQDTVDYGKVSKA